MKKEFKVLDPQEVLEVEVKVSPGLEELPPIEDVREEQWMISDEYLTLGLHMAALQFVDRDKHFTFEQKEEFIEEAIEVVRQNTPIVYAYLFQFNHAGRYAIPLGSVDIILAFIQQTKPDFFGGVKSVQSKIILPNG